MQHTIVEERDLKITVEDQPDQDDCMAVQVSRPRSKQQLEFVLDESAVWQLRTAIDRFLEVFKQRDLENRQSSAAWHAYMSEQEDPPQA